MYSLSLFLLIFAGEGGALPIDYYIEVDGRSSTGRMREYQIYLDEVTFPKAWAVCRDAGGRLVKKEPPKYYEMDLLQMHQTVEMDSSLEFWLGLIYLAGRSSWQAADTCESVNMTMDAIDGKTNECVTYNITSEKKRDVTNCHEHHTFICVVTIGHDCSLDVYEDYAVFDPEVFLNVSMSFNVTEEDCKSKCLSWINCNSYSYTSGNALFSLMENATCVLYSDLQSKNYTLYADEETVHSVKNCIIVRVSNDSLTDKYDNSSLFLPCTSASHLVDIVASTTSKSSGSTSTYPTTDSTRFAFTQSLAFSTPDATVSVAVIQPTRTITPTAEEESIHVYSSEAGITSLSSAPYTQTQWLNNWLVPSQTVTDVTDSSISASFVATFGRSVKSVKFTISSAVLPQGTLDVSHFTSWQTPEQLWSSVTDDVFTSTRREYDVTTTATESSSQNIYCIQACSSQCRRNNTNVMTETQLIEKVKELESNLTVRKDATGNNRRKLESANDKRTSSTLMGYVAVLILSLGLGIIVVPDIAKFLSGALKFVRGH